MEHQGLAGIWCACLVSSQTRTSSLNQAPNGKNQTLNGESETVKKNILNSTKGVIYTESHSFLFVCLFSPLWESWRGAYSIDDGVTWRKNRERREKQQTCLANFRHLKNLHHVNASPLLSRWFIFKWHSSQALLSAQKTLFPFSCFKVSRSLKRSETFGWNFNSERNFISLMCNMCEPWFLEMEWLLQDSHLSTGVPLNYYDEWS